MIERRDLVSSAVAARELGVHVRSLQRWVRQGLIQPDSWTAGGHARWDIERVRSDIRRDVEQRRLHG